MEERWYKLDNAAKIYPAVRRKYWAPIFRLDAVLKDEVNPECLNYALIMTYKRFPTFSVNIAKGLFWYYFEPKKSSPEAALEDTYPLRPFNERVDRGYLFRVLYYKKRISLEVFHGITDGSGALVFLKSLLFNYFTIMNDREPAPIEELEKYGILYYKDLPSPGEMEDSFQHYALENVALNLKEKPAFHIPGTRIKQGTLRVTHVLININQLIRLSKGMDMTITGFLASLLALSIINSRVYKASDKDPIKINIPVNLRKRFPSNTLRNFSSYLNVEIFPGSLNSPVDFNELCATVKEQLKEGIDVSILRAKFSSNVNAERNIMMRISPLFLKNLVLASFFTLYGERLNTAVLSNIGNVTLPEGMASMVERFNFMNGLPKKYVICCGAVSFKDTLSFSFTSNVYENEFLKEMVAYLTDHGVDVRLETNY